MAVKPSKGMPTKVHVQNPTAIPMYDELGVDFIFQPDQTKSPGTYGFEIGPDGRRVRLANGRCKLVKISDEKASNVTVVPHAWVEAVWQSEATRAAKGLTGLIIVETKAEGLVKENERLKKEAINVEKQKAQLVELQAALSDLEGTAPAGTDIAKGVAGIRARIASLVSPSSSKKG